MKKKTQKSGMRVGLGMAGLAALIALALSPVVSPVARDLSGGSHEDELAAVSDQTDPEASHEGEAVKGWMTFAEVEQVTGTPSQDLIACLGMPADVPLDVAVRDLGEEHGFQVEEVRAAAVPQSGAGPGDLLSAWVDLWASYDLSDVRNLFLDDARLTYFSSETEGLIVGFQPVYNHHAGFGFVEGGSQPGSELWVDDVKISDFGRTAVVAAVWYFGDPTEVESAQQGPMTMGVVDQGSGYRIAHMHFAEYLATETE
jgi:hypothetical protein